MKTAQECAEMARVYRAAADFLVADPSPAARQVEAIFLGEAVRYKRMARRRETSRKKESA